MTEKILNRIRASISRPDIEFYNVPLVVEMDKSDAYWLIQEAERAEDIDMYRDYLDREKNRTYLLEQENKRLREAIILVRSTTLNDNVYKILGEALEPPT